MLTRDEDDDEEDDDGIDELPRTGMKLSIPCNDVDVLAIRRLSPFTIGALTLANRSSSRFTLRGDIFTVIGLLGNVSGSVSGSWSCS